MTETDDVKKLLRDRVDTRKFLVRTKSRNISDMTSLMGNTPDCIIQEDIDILKTWVKELGDCFEKYQHALKNLEKSEQKGWLK